MANKGKTIDPMSEDMKNLVAFIQSLAKGAVTEMKEGTEQKKDDTIEKMKEKMIMEEMKEKMPKKLPGY